MKPLWYLVSAIGLSVILSVYGVVLVLRDVAVGDVLSTVWMLVFALLVALWAKGDAAEKQIERTLDFPAYFFLAWPLALPWYLARTRGAEGVVLFFGFVALYFAPTVSGYVVYAYAYAE